MSGVALTPLGGCLGFLQTGQGGVCLSNAGQGGQGRAGEPLQGRACVPVFKAGAQAWPGLPANQGRVGMGIILTLGGCVAAQGHGETLASPCQPEGNAGELVGPWACCRISRRLTRNRGHPSANVKKQ